MEEEEGGGGTTTLVVGSVDELVVEVASDPARETIESPMAMEEEEDPFAAVLGLVEESCWS